MKNEEYLRAKRFRQQEAFDALYRDKIPPVRLDEKWQLYEFAAKTVGESEPLAYLEFGVHKGESLLYWASKLQHPETRFVGFDSFHGLPEAWEFYHGSMNAGAFSTGGRLPRTDDKRISFVKGWFQNTVPDFLATPPPHGAARSAGNDPLRCRPVFLDVIPTLRAVERYFRLPLYHG